MFKCILIPTDGGELCEKAIRLGVDIGKVSGARIIGLNVTLPLHTSMPLTLIPKQVRDVVNAETAKIVAEKLAAVEREARVAGVEVETIHASSDYPWEEIVRVAKEKQCDLIVMASHARRGPAAMILGSQTQKVLTHASAPVLVVR